MDKILRLLGGSAFLALIQFLSMPIISRLFSKEDLGRYIFFVSVFSVLAVFFSGRLDMQLLQRKRTKEVFFGGVIVSSVLFLLTCIIFLFFDDELYLYGAFSAWIVCISSFFYYLSIKKSLVNIVFLTRLVQGSVFIALIFLSFYINLKNQLVWIEIISRLLVLLVFASFFFKSIFKLGENKIWRYWKGFVYTLRILFKYKLFFLTAVLGALSIHLNIFLFNFYLSASFVAMYFFVYKALSMPVSLVSKPISDTLLNDVNNSMSSAESKNILIKYMENITIISVGLYSFSFFNSEYIFTTLFGKVWEDIGLVGSLLSIVVMFWSFVTPLSSMLFYCNKQKTGLFITFIDIFIKVLAIYFGVVLGNELVTLVVFVTLTSILYFTTLWRILYYFDVPIFVFLKRLLGCLFFFLIPIILIFLGLDDLDVLIYSSFNVVFYFLWFYNDLLCNWFKKLA